MRRTKELDETTAADERDPFATPKRVDETSNAWEGASRAAERRAEFFRRVLVLPASFVRL